MTYHRPGQLVAYPIIRIHGGQDARAFVRALEQAVINTVAELGVTSERVEGRSGVWFREAGMPDRKLGAIGARPTNRTTTHLLALNVTSDRRDGERVVPSYLRDKDMISLAELGVAATMSEIVDLLHPHLELELAPFRDPKEVATERAVADAFAPVLRA